MAAGSIRVTMEVGADGVALITIANPPVNALHPISKQHPLARALPPSISPWASEFAPGSSIRCSNINGPARGSASRAVIAGLKDKYAEAARRDDVKAIVLTGQIPRPHPRPASPCVIRSPTALNDNVALTTAC